MPACYRGLLQIPFIRNECWLVYSPGYCSVQLPLESLPREVQITKQCWTKPKPEAFQSSILQGLHRGIDKLRDVIWGGNSKISCYSVKQVTPVCMQTVYLYVYVCRLRIIASISTCNAPRQKSSLAGRLTQKFLGESFVIINALDTQHTSFSKPADP